MSNSYIKQAIAYFKLNKEGVMNLVKNDKTGLSLRPGISEWEKPEIWQGSHWKWLLEHLRKSQ